MDTMVRVLPAVQRPRSISLPAGPAAAGKARSHVRSAIRDWNVPVDPFTAALLTSELVTNAIRHEPGKTIRLYISCSGRHLRVYVHDRALSMPVPIDAPVEAEKGRGLMLVDSLSTDWGFFRTPAGKAVYFTLAFETDRDETGDPAAGSGRSGRAP